MREQVFSSGRSPVGILGVRFLQRSSQHLGLTCRFVEENLGTTYFMKTGFTQKYKKTRNIRTPEI